jgi:hypothetical protein
MDLELRAIASTPKKKEERRRNKSELEGWTVTASNHYPRSEDFEVGSARDVPRTARAAIQRALNAGTPVRKEILSHRPGRCVRWPQPAEGAGFV